MRSKAMSASLIHHSMLNIKCQSCQKLCNIMLPNMKLFHQYILYEPESPVFSM